MSEPSKSTRERLLFAAERLFAEYGVDGVSLRQVNAEAGQRNSSAAHYHFGSKEALIEAIYKSRMEQVNERRATMVEEIIAADEHQNLRKLVEAIVLPITEQIYETKGGRSYVRFVAQVHGRPRTDILIFARKGAAPSLQWIFTQVRATLSHIPPEIVGPRIGFMFALLYTTLAYRENIKLLPDLKSTQSKTLFVNNLMDSLVGCLSAPLSEETLNELQQ